MNHILFQWVMEGWREGWVDLCLGLRGYSDDQKDIYLGRMSVTFQGE
jgi:hypothetical protein